MPFPLVAAAAPYAIPAIVSLLTSLLQNKMSQGGSSQQVGGNQSAPGISQLGGSGGYASRFAPNQLSVLQQLLGQGMSGVQQLQQPFDFGPIEQQARRGFQEQTIPGIMERFTSLGSGGSQGSSAFAQLLGRSGSDLESNLAAMKAQYGMQDLGRRQNLATNLLQLGTQSPYGDYIQRQPGFGESLGGPLLQGAGMAAALYGGNKLSDWLNKPKAPTAPAPK